MHSALIQDEEPETSTSNYAMAEGVHFQGEDQDAEESDTITLSSQPSEGTEPEGEVSVWWDEKERQNERRQTLNDAIGNLSGGRFSPVLFTLNGMTFPLPNKSIMYERRGKPSRPHFQS